MPYPWPSFSTFTWQKAEAAVYGSDTGWQAAATYARNKVLGGVADSIIVMTQGSMERSFKCYLSEPRLAELQALLGIADTFCDWARPTPAVRAAFLAEVVAGEAIETENRDAQKDADNRPLTRRRAVDVTFISQ